MIPQTPDIMPSPLCNEGDTRNIPEDTPLGTNQLSYKLGFPPITSIDVKAGGIAPSRVDINAALKLLSIHTYFLQSGNKYKYSNLLDYEIGSTVIGSDNALYYCIQANGATPPNTVQNPVSTSSYWLKIINSNGKINADNLSVTLGSLATKSTITSADITDGTIVNGDIKDATITGSKLANNTITATQLAPDSVGASELADNAVTSSKIADGTIVNGNIKDATITGSKLANNTITAAQLAPNSVGASELADNAVDTASIQNGAVTQAKLASNVVGNLPIGFIYFQLRGQSTPEELFGSSGKWQDISNTYAGEFFRAVGGNSGNFGNTQAEGLPNITGNSGAINLAQYVAGAGTGALRQIDGGISHGSAINVINRPIITFNASLSNSIYGASTHVTPYNSAVRIWKKIA